MNRRLVGGVAFAAAVMMCVVASAQPGGQRGQRGGFGRGNAGITQLLMNEAVREDLGIKDDQVTELREMVQSLRGETPAFDREAFQNLSAEERREQMEKLTAAREKVEAKLKEKLGEILKKEQIARLEQIQLQVAGVGMFRNPKVVEALKLTDEQTTEMGTAQREAFQEMRRSVFGRPPRTRANGRTAEENDGHCHESVER